MQQHALSCSHMHATLYDASAYTPPSLLVGHAQGDGHVVERQAGHLGLVDQGDEEADRRSIVVVAHVRRLILAEVLDDVPGAFRAVNQQSFLPEA